MMKKTATLIMISLLFYACQTSTKPSNSKEETLIFKDSLGHILNKSDIASATGLVNYEILEDKKIDPRAQSLHQEARKLGQAGKYDEAIIKLNEAVTIQPDWAYPIYDLAFTYLLKGDNENALHFYRKTDELKPNGFFTAKTAIYSLEGEKSGKFPEGLYMAYLQIEWTQDVNKKIEIARTITQQTPGFAPAWKDLANLLDDKKERLQAIEQGLSKNPDAETKGMLIINKALIIGNDGNKEEARNILGNLIFSPEVTTGNIELAKFALQSISKE